MPFGAEQDLSSVVVHARSAGLATHPQNRFARE